MEELISVIVPIYKVQKYLDRCLKSIVSQSYRNLEIILVNDGSPDKCGEICDRWAEHDERIKVIHKKNGGLSDARNAGIDIAKGKYFSFIDSDDYVHMDFIKVLYGLIKKYDCDISMCGNYITSEDLDYTTSLSIGNERVIKSEDVLKKKENLYCVSWNKLYKKEIFEKIRYPVGKIHEDVGVIFKIMYSSSKIAITDLKLYYYFNNPDSIMRQEYSIKRLDVIDLLYDSYEYFIEKGELEYAYLVLKDYVDTILDEYRVVSKIGLEGKDIKRKLRKLYNNNYLSVIRNVDMGFLYKIKYIVYRIIPKLHSHFSKKELCNI